MDGKTKGRKFWISLSYGAVRIEPGQADFSLSESCPPPGKPGLRARHARRSYDEAWFIAEGTIELLLDSRRERQSAREFAFVPRGHTHSFADPARPGPDPGDRELTGPGHGRRDRLPGEREPPHQ
jgi:hypothetical protein